MPIRVDDQSRRFSTIRCTSTDIEILGGIFPEETGGKVENLKFRFCHIDVDVYLSAKDVTEWIWEWLVPAA